MVQITQTDLIRFIEEKKENVMDWLYDTKATEKDLHKAQLKKESCLAKMDIYQGLLNYLNNVEIVPEKIEETTNLAKLYSGKKVCVHTKERIVGSRTPFTAIGKIEYDDDNYIEMKDEFDAHIIITKEDIECIEIIPEHEMSPITTIQEEVGNTSQEDLKKMLEKISITPYDEPKVESLRNDRVREFESAYEGKVCIDAKEIKYIYCEKEEDGDIAIITIDRIFISKETNDYNDIVEWWKYWKQN